MDVCHFLNLSVDGPTEMILIIAQNDFELRNPNSHDSIGLALSWFVEAKTEVSHLWLHICHSRT